MPKSKAKRILIWFFRNMRILMMAWMIGIANAIQQDAKFMDETAFKIEQVESTENEEPFQDLEEENK